MSALGDIAGGILKTVAPTIATALGGPLAGMAVGFVAKKLLGGGDHSADEISKMITSMNHPDDLQKLKDAENEFTAKMKELEIDVFSLEVKDRNSARNMAVSSVGMARMQMLIGTILVGGFIAMAAGVIGGYVDIADANKAVMIGTVIGYVSAKAYQVVAFLFGSTHGSQSKSTDMANALQAAVRK